MHLLVRERHGIDAQDVAEDLGHEPADVVFLSFSDSDLLALEQAYFRLSEPKFSFRLANLARLRHPMSVDLYVEQTIALSRCVVVRLLGGVDYWRYGVEEVRNCCKRLGIKLVLLPGDARDDERLSQWSGVDGNTHARLDGFLRFGGPENVRGALTLMASLAGQGNDDGSSPAPLPAAGIYLSIASGQPYRAVIVFYRAHLLANDVSAIDELAKALEKQGIAADAVYVSSLKSAEAATFLRAQLCASNPHVVLNATFFAARGEAGASSPLDEAGVPVLQVLQPGSTFAAWNESARGLSQTDLAMQVVLPELDGRLSSAPISFKGESAPGLPARHTPYEPGILSAAMQAKGWARLAVLTPSERRIAIVLSDYPGASGQMAHAVGLDAFASLCSIFSLLKDAGYDCDPAPFSSPSSLIGKLCEGEGNVILTLDEYTEAFETLPEGFRESIIDAWGEPEEDASLRDGMFCLRYIAFGKIIVAVQPDRGSEQDRKAQYHDPDRPPRHAYVAFYLWLRRKMAVDAMVHLGTHGTLEWLPGKAVALSDSCAPDVLSGGMPVIYPFIVNNPGEAAAAKRRLGAVTIGHMTPPVMKAGLDEHMAELERLIDEFAEADGLDRRRGAILRRQILERATGMGVLAESGVRSGDGDETEALARLDAYLCDVKDLQIRDGLHVFGKVAPRIDTLVETISSAGGGSAEEVAIRVRASAQAEAHALLDALDGRFIEPGPASAPTRGRMDVLPTGRNLFTVDPRAIPTAAAVELARLQERQMLLRHLQEEGEPLQRIVMDIWGSASLRTGGEDLALALLLMGVVPVWDDGSGRVSGIEIIPLAVLDRPRVDVTLRISGLFRDAFPAQIALFDQAVQAVAAREEDAEWNPLAGTVYGLEGQARADASARIFGAAPGAYGTGIEAALADNSWQDSDALGRSFIAGSGWAYGGGREGQRMDDAFALRMQQADAIVHVQDHAEMDILESPDIAAHEGGLAAAAQAMGATPTLWHGDTSRPDAPKLRDMQAEIARVVRGRLANPRWLEGMRQHDYRGAAEISRGLDALCGFAATLPTRFDRQFDLVFAATLGDPACDDFLKAMNPQAREAMRLRFVQMVERGLWHPRLNSTMAQLDGEA